MQQGGTNNLSSVVSVFNRDEKEHEVRVKAESFNLPYFDIRTIELAPDVLSFVSKEEATLGVVPLVKKGSKILVGIADPKKPEALAIIKYLKEYLTVEPVLISWDAVKDALPQYEGLVKQVLNKPEDYEIEAVEKALTFKELESHINNAPLTDILKFVVTMAIQSESSDIHIEPEKEGARLRFRIDGVLHIVGRLTSERYNYILSQIELSSGLKLNVDEAQEGRLEVKLKDKNISVRVETMPTLHGDDVSLRIFNTEATRLTLDDLGLSDFHKKVLEKTIARPQGMILVVGPTGAGKTSTIYAVLNVLNQPEIKIITLEDPIEYALTGITQSQINEGESYDDRLKAVLREDPDVVMIGEVRDAKTADVALHAALTGHIMISTFHANNAVTAIGLLKELSENAALLASAISLLISQRLVRRLCPTCKKEHVLEADEKEFIERVMSEIPDELKEGKEMKFFEPVGCDDCKGLGYKGRIGVFELLPLTVELQKIVSREDLTSDEMQVIAKKAGMVTMEQDGLLKALSGVTSISEVTKAVAE